MALHGLYGTYDMSWRADLGTTLLVLALVSAQWLLLARAGAGGSAVAAPGSALGPFLFLQMLIFQSIARLTVLTGCSQECAFGWVLASQILGLGVAAGLTGRPRLGGGNWRGASNGQPELL